ncbi:hypothetical protein ACXR2T_06280 [Leucobacter sp. HY1910]
MTTFCSKEALLFKSKMLIKARPVLSGALSGAERCEVKQIGFVFQAANLLQ